VSSYTLTVTGTSGKVNGSVQAGLTVNYPTALVASLGNADWRGAASRRPGEASL